jgi:hypothetical protein
MTHLRCPVHELLAILLWALLVVVSILDSGKILKLLTVV